MTEFQVPVMQHLRQVLAITFLVSLLGGCSNTRHWAPEACPEPVQRLDKPSAEAETEPITPEYQPVVYRLDKHRTLEIWDTEANRHYAFFKDGKLIRSEPLLYSSATPVFPDVDPILSSPAVSLTGTKSRFVVVCQHDDNHYLHSVFKIASSFPKVAELKSSAPLNLVKVGNSYRFSGIDYLPGSGAQQFNPTVLFKFENGKLRLDLESMRKQLPSRTELREVKRYIRSRFNEPNDIPAELFETVFAFYYCGEVAKAEQFYNSVYPKKVGQKAYWWQFIKEQIAQSPFRKEIER